MKRYTLFLLLAFLSAALGAEPYRTRMFDTSIASLMVTRTGSSYAFPVIELNSNQSVDISFDQLSYQPKSYYYKIIHCDAFWNPSSISEMEYFSGFASGTIDDYDYSINTTVEYVHYNLQLPNENLQILLSGNYAVIIAEDQDFDHPTAIACFSVFEPLTAVQVEVRGSTDLEINGRYQQLDIEVNYDKLKVADPMSELLVNVYQNGRYDNAALNLKPTYLQNNKVIYKSNKALIFEGGNSYRTIDFSSQYTYGSGIDRIEYSKEMYHVQVEPSLKRVGTNPDLSADADGAMVINKQGAEDSDTEADYYWVHFTLPWAGSLPQGGVYILGDFNHNAFDSFVRMDYQNGAFYKSILLKQGGYNFQYVVVSGKNQKASLQPIEGSFWQVDNSYQVFVFYKPFGARYDRLVGYELKY